MLNIDALSIVSSKQLHFPFALQVSETDFQTVLIEAWQTINTIDQSLQKYDLVYGKLLLANLNEDIVAESGFFGFEILADGQVKLTVNTYVELVFDFQSTLWQRLEAIGSTLDYLRQLCTTMTGMTLIFTPHKELYPPIIIP